LILETNLNGGSVTQELIVKVNREPQGKKKLAASLGGTIQSYMIVRPRIR